MKKKLMLGQLKKGLKIDNIELEVFLKYYLQEIKHEDLTSMQQEKLERYKKSWAMYSEGKTKDNILSTLELDYKIEYRQAQVDFATAIKLFGPIDTVDKDGRRLASMHFFDMLADLAKQEKNYEAAIKAKEAANKLSGIYEVETEGWDPRLWLKPSKTIYVTKVDVHNYTQENSQTIELDE
jgi:tetratricopeptide (TPR) repeat protein